MIMQEKNNNKLHDNARKYNSKLYDNARKK